MFDHFVEGMVEADRLQLFVRHAGTGPAVLLLHGHPRTSATWHRVAPQLLARGLTVVCADLPGYGRSGKPMPTADHVPHSKRAVARHLLAALRTLGHERFAVAGHDRGSYYALRLALDHPEFVSRVALLDCSPISEHLDRVDARFATAWGHWFLFAQPEIPERIITAERIRLPAGLSQQSPDRLRKRVIAIFMQHAFGYAVRPSCLADGGAHYPGGLPGYAEPVSSE